VEGEFITQRSILKYMFLRIGTLSNLFLSPPKEASRTFAVSMGPSFFSSHTYSLSSFFFSCPLKTLKRFDAFACSQYFQLGFYLFTFFLLSSASFMVSLKASNVNTVWQLLQNFEVGLFGSLQCGYGL
jgi:hypothetical protein